MKSFRRSLGEKSKDGAAAPHGAGLPTTLSKPTASIQPPKKVIRAKESHVSTSPQELPFNKGDFFYVVGERDDPHGGPGYYEALSESPSFGETTQAWMQRRLADTLVLSLRRYDVERPRSRLEGQVRGVWPLGRPRQQGFHLREPE